MTLLDLRLPRLDMAVGWGVGEAESNGNTRLNIHSSENVLQWLASVSAHKAREGE